MADIAASGFDTKWDDHVMVCRRNGMLQTMQVQRNRPMFMIDMSTRASESCPWPIHRPFCKGVTLISALESYRYALATSFSLQWMGIQHRKLPNRATLYPNLMLYTCNHEQLAAFFKPVVQQSIFV